MKISYLTMWLRETLGSQELQRKLEPMLMENQDQVDAYAQFGLRDSALRASYLYHAIEITKVIQNCKSVVDLGCGPATQLCMVAMLNPNIQFTGCDLSETMIATAKRNAEKLKLKNINFLLDDITSMQKIPDHSTDGVMSTVVLHHLPGMMELEKCIQTVQRILKPEGAVYLLDFTLMKSQKSVDFLVQLNGTQPELFRLDYLYSLLAAFPLTAFETLATKHLPHAGLVTTFGVPFMAVIKTGIHQLPEDAARLAQIEKQILSDSNRSLFRDLEIAFAIGPHRRAPPSSK